MDRLTGADLARQRYNDGRTDGREYCRTHSEAGRAEELIWARRMAQLVTDHGQDYWRGYYEILVSWIDGQGA